MVCTHCGKGELIPTLVPRIAGGLQRVGYGAAIAAVLVVGTGVGWVLGESSEEGSGLAWTLIALPVSLILSTPLVIIGALRVFSEVEVLRCPDCDHTVDRALAESLKSSQQVTPSST